MYIYICIYLHICNYINTISDIYTNIIILIDRDCSMHYHLGL